MWLLGISSRVNQTKSQQIRVLFSRNKSYRAYPNYILAFMSPLQVLKPTKIEPEVLLVYLRSPIVCEILDLHTTASMYPAISTEDLLKIPIALPKESVRRKITEKLKESRRAQEQSKQLLEIAKTGVERAIATDETTAIAWMNEQLEAIEIKISN